MTIEGPLSEALPALLASVTARRILLITGESRRYVDRVRAALPGAAIEVFDGARRHVPEAVLRDAREKLGAFRADTLVTVGGGSTIGLGKALRLQHDARFVAVPTTYAGSEQTCMYGTTAGGQKTTGRDPRVRPDDVVYDVDLTLDMPKALTAQSLMNALAHPLSTLGEGALDDDGRAQAFAAVQVVYAALEALSQAPRSRPARAAALRGAGLAAQALERGTPGLHHQLAHRLGGRWDLDHGGLHGVLLPHTVRRLRDESPALVDELERRLEVSDLEGSLFDFLVRAGAPPSLGALGVSWDGLLELIAAAPELPRDLLSAAFHGWRPSRDTRWRAH
jgi:maleylacetate reductase